MRILWHSNSPKSGNTGYGVQTRRFAKRIYDLGHEVLISSFFGDDVGVTIWEGLPILPKRHNAWGVDAIPIHALKQRVDIVIAHLDSWVLRDMDKSAMRFVPWFPVDSEPLPPPIRDTIRQAFERIVFSRFGERQVRDAGLDCVYVPHGVPCDQYKPLDRRDARRALNLPEDAFIIGMVAANKGKPNRKAITFQMRAFADFKQTHDDAILYIHTDPHSPHGENLVEYAEHLGLRPKLDIGFSPPYETWLGFNDDMMVQTFNAFDVLSSTSFGEGFGVPVLEAEACGVPVITGGWTAMEELTFAGWMLDKDTESLPWWTPHATYMYQPFPWAIKERYDAAYDALQNTKTRQKLSKKARAGALRYDCDAVTEKYWKPVLEGIEKRIAGDGPENAGPMLRQLLERSKSKPVGDDPAALAVGPGGDE